jgi:hypothetical protein
LFVGSYSSVDEQQVVALLEVINHEQLLSWASLALLPRHFSSSFRLVPECPPRVKAAILGAQGTYPTLAWASVPVLLAPGIRFR